MGESACLVRPFCHASDTSVETREGDPVRALEESISFGRFVSESLAWEKWSSFSHNRYLEEAEKFSRPGSVAQKKAYFEAHYKRIAAKKAAALLEESDAAANVMETQITEETHQNASVNSEIAESNSYAAFDIPENTEIANFVDAHECNADVERQRLDGPKMEIANPLKHESVIEKNAGIVEAATSVDANGCNPNVEGYELEKSKVEEAGQSTAQIIKENPNQDEFPNQHKNVGTHDKPMAFPGRKLTVEEAANQENLASISTRRPTVSFSKPLAYSRASKLTSSPTQKTLAHQRKDSASPSSKKPARDSLNKKRSTRSIHMSINFASYAEESCKATSSILEKIENSRNLTSFVQMSKGTLAPLRTSIRGPMNGVLKHSPLTSQSENKRTKLLLDHSVTGRRAAEGKFTSLNMDHSHSSNVSRSKPRTGTVFSPFSFRSEERAAKRKEFFQKLEEKTNEKESEKAVSKTKAKEKAEIDLKRMRQSVGCKAKSFAESYGETGSPTKHVKVQQIRPQSPKIGRKLCSGIVQDTNSRPPRRPSVRTDGSKRVTEKSNTGPACSITSLLKKNTHENGPKRAIERKGLTCSVSSLPRRKTHENASPNIKL